MPRCELTGKRPRCKSLRSHSNIRTRKKAFPNVQQKRIFSPGLKRLVSLKMATSTIRDMEHQGGFDTFILRQPNDLLSKRALDIKKQLQAKHRPKTGSV